MLFPVFYVLIVITILMFLCMPFVEIRLGFVFRANKLEYGKIVKRIDEEIKNGKIVLDGNLSCTSLPPTEEYHLISIHSIWLCSSRDGHGYFIRFTEAGTFSYDAGHIYVSPDCEISTCVPYYEIFRPVAPNWYFYKWDTIAG